MLSAPPETSSLKDATGNPVRFEETEWFGRACAFLQENPDSTLLAIAQHVWPTFLMFPEDRRVNYWFWLDREFNSLRARGWLCTRVGDDGVRTWSLAGTQLRK